MRHVLLLALFLVSSQSLGAEFFDGEKAYIRGDFKKAITVFEPLVQRGHSGAELMTGIMYLRGEGYTANPRAAAVWFYKAARKGSHSAQLVLGTQRLHGHGVNRNLVKAYVWLTLALRSPKEGVAERALSFRQDAIRIMTLEEIRLGKKRVNAWRSAADRFER